MRIFKYSIFVSIESALVTFQTFSLFVKANKSQPFIGLIVAESISYKNVLKKMKRKFKTIKNRARKFYGQSRLPQKLPEKIKKFKQKLVFQPPSIGLTFTVPECLFPVKDKMVILV